MAHDSYLIVILWCYIVGSTFTVVLLSRKDGFYGIEIFVPCHCLTYEMLVLFEKVVIS